nr:retrovirus-related Pol polyprotein from transposon TNT 1-94 [Tanacetum cinerariifolium]
MSEPSYKSPVTGYSLVSKGFQPKFTPKLIQSSQNSISQADPKVQKDYKDEEEVSNNKEVTQVKVLMALTDDELTVGKNHARIGERIDITMRKVNILLSMDEDADWQIYLKYNKIDLKDELLVLKQAKLDAFTFQIQNTKLTKLNHALQEQLKKEKKINEKWLTSSKKVSQCVIEQIPYQKKKVLGGEMLTESSYKMNEMKIFSFLLPWGSSKQFDAKADDGYFLGYSFVLNVFRVFNTRRQQVKETYHVTFNESMEAIGLTNISKDEIRINDSSRYPPDEFLYEDDPSKQYQVNSDVSYYVIPHRRLLTELTQENHIPEVIALNEPDIPLTKDNEGPPDLINTEWIHAQNVLNEQITTQPTEGPLGNNTEILVSINESLVHDVPQSHISNQASTSSHPAPLDIWSKDQHIELVNIIGDPGEGMLTRSIDAKLIAASASECLFADFLFKIEPKKLIRVVTNPNNATRAYDQVVTVTTCLEINPYSLGFWLGCDDDVVVYIKWNRSKQVVNVLYYSLMVATATRHSTAGDLKYWCFTDAKKCHKKIWEE